MQFLNLWIIVRFRQIWSQHIIRLSSSQTFFESVRNSMISLSFKRSTFCSALHIFVLSLNFFLCLSFSRPFWLRINAPLFVRPFPIAKYVRSIHFVRYLQIFYYYYYSGNACDGRDQWEWNRKWVRPAGNQNQPNKTLRYQRGKAYGSEQRFPIIPICIIKTTIVWQKWQKPFGFLYSMRMVKYSFPVIL